MQRGAVIEWLERSTVVRKVSGLSLAQVNDWKTLTVHQAVNRRLKAGKREEWVPPFKCCAQDRMGP